MKNEYPKIEIQQIQKGEYLRFKEIRIRGLTEDANSFGTTIDQASSWPIESWISQVENIPTFIAKINGDGAHTDVGVVRVAKDTVDPKVAWIISMWVAPESRAKKIGKKLLEVAIQWAKKNGYSILKLDVADFNISAIKLYENMGFKNNGVTGSLPEPRAHIKEHQKEMKLED